MTFSPMLDREAASQHLKAIGSGDVFVDKASALSARLFSLPDDLDAALEHAEEVSRSTDVYVTAAWFRPGAARRLRAYVVAAQHCHADVDHGWNAEHEALFAELRERLGGAISRLRTSSEQGTDGAEVPRYQLQVWFDTELTADEMEAANGAFGAAFDGDRSDRGAERWVRLAGSIHHPDLTKDAGDPYRDHPTPVVWIEAPTGVTTTLHALYESLGQVKPIATKRNTSVVAGWDEMPHESGLGERTLVSVAGSLRRNGASRATIAACLEAVAAITMTEDPMPAHRIRRIAKSACKWQPEPPSSVVVGSSEEADAILAMWDEG